MLCFSNNLHYFCQKRTALLNSFVDFSKAELSHLCDKYVRYRNLTLNQIFDKLDDEDEASGLVKHIEAQNLYITSADDGAVTDKGSGEEEHTDISNLPSTQ